MHPPPCAGSIKLNENIDKTLKQVPNFDVHTCIALSCRRIVETWLPNCPQLFSFAFQTIGHSLGFFISCYSIFNEGIY